MNLATNLQILRKRKGYSQQQLAERMNVSRQTISKWEMNAAVPETDKLIALSDYLDCTIDELLKGEISDPSSVTSKEKESVVIGADYDSFMNRYAIMMGMGVFFIIFSVAVMLIIEGLFHSEGLSVSVMMIFLGIGIMLLFYANYRRLLFKKETPCVTFQYSDELKVELHKRKSILLTICIGIDLFAVALMIFLSETFYLDEDFSVGVMLLLISGAVGCTVYISLLVQKIKTEQYNQEKTSEL